MRPRSFAALAALLLAAAGCTSLGIKPTTTVHADYEQIWDAATDVVSSFMHLQEASKEKGRIVGGLSSKWQRSQAEVTIVNKDGAFDVVVRVYRETFRQYVTAEGVGTYQPWVRTGRDKAMERKILLEIHKALKEAKAKPASAS